MTAARRVDAASVVCCCCVVVLLFASALVRVVPRAEAAEVFRDCGGVLRGPRGVISTPGFPRPYPVPIACRWVLEASPRQRVALYLTQFYMREGVTVSEYLFYSDEQLNMGGTLIGSISSESEPTHVLSNKPVMVIDFQVREPGNIHHRVLDLFLDVYGFNITYEMLEANESLRTDPCLGHHCSFTGVCLAAAEWSRYSCSCLGDFYGDECQFSPRCGPDSNSRATSLCHNGGTCRYYIGSKTQTCICPPEYRGSRCEYLARPEQVLDCGQLNCTQHCIETGPQPHCECNPGFRLDDDGRTCSPASRTRFLVQVKLYDRNVDLARLDSKSRSQLQAGLEEALKSLFASQTKAFDNLAVLQFMPNAVVQFHLFGRQEERATVESVLEEALKGGKLGPFAVDREFLQISQEPAMHIEMMQVSPRTPRVGEELMVACMAVGSSALTVHWFKDGFPVDSDVPFRSLWTSRVAKNQRDQYTLLLGIDRATTLDGGVFTCQISDWGAVQNKSMRVRLDVAPRPLVSPLAVTLLEGQPLELSCLSPHAGGSGPLGFRWLRNDRLLPHRSPELTEDLYPAGSRLVLAEARSSATYTCVATGPLGSGRADAFVTVLAPHVSTEVCPAEESHGVQWQRTAAHSRDVQACPQPLYVEGRLERPCRLSLDRQAVWGSPDFSGCTDARLAQIQWKLESMRMGYLVSSGQQLSVELRQYLQGRPLQPGEGRPLVRFLGGLVDYLSHPVLRHGGQPALAATDAIWDVTSHLLAHKPLLLQDHTMIDQLQKHILRFGLLAAAALSPGRFKNFDRPAVVVSIGRITRHAPDAAVVRVPLPGAATSAWTGNSLELNLKQESQGDHGELLAAVALFKTLNELLPERFLAQQGNREERSHELHSHLISVDLSSSGGVGIRVQLVHIRPQANQEIVCGIADFSHRVHFLLDGCQAETPVNNKSYTWCSCDRPGTYALLVGEEPKPLEEEGQVADVVAGLGCGVCLVLVLLTLAVVAVRCCRQFRSQGSCCGLATLHAQVCLALCGACATLFQGVQGRLSPRMYPYAVSVLQLCLLAACCLQLCVALVLYVQLVDARTVHHAAFKVAALGWAVPVIVVGANLAAQVLEGFRLESWWLTLRTPTGHLSNYFCAYVASLAIITALHFLLFLTVRGELRRQRLMGISKKQAPTSRSTLLVGSMLVLVGLLAVSLTSILYVNMGGSLLRSYLLAASLGLLGLLVFFLYVVAAREKQAPSPTLQARTNSGKGALSSTSAHSVGTLRRFCDCQWEMACDEVWPQGSAHSNALNVILQLICHAACGNDTALSFLFCLFLAHIKLHFQCKHSPTLVIRTQCNH
ncbi:uncharacterized protein LOC144107686 isoform X2 [Amblyomma americanum]